MAQYEWKKLPVEGSVSIVLDSVESAYGSDVPRAHRQLAASYEIESPTMFQVRVFDKKKEIISIASDGNYVTVNDTEFPVDKMYDEDHWIRLWPYHIIVMHRFPISQGLKLKPEHLSEVMQRWQVTTKLGEEKGSVSIGTAGGNLCWRYTLNLYERPSLAEYSTKLGGNTIEKYEFSGRTGSISITEYLDTDTMVGEISGIFSFTSVMED